MVLKVSDAEKKAIENGTNQLLKEALKGEDIEDIKKENRNPGPSFNETWRSYL